MRDYKILFLPMIFAAGLFQAQNIVVGADKMPLATFEKDYKEALEAHGVDTSIKSYINFKLIQNRVREMKVDTLPYFRQNAALLLNELKKNDFYPKTLEEKYLNDYLQANQKEYEVQLFFAPKRPNDSNDYDKIYKQIKDGVIDFADAITAYTSGTADSLYVKAGTLNYDLDREVRNLPVGQFSKVLKNSDYTAFVKKLAERPSLGYLIFGTISYADDANAAAKKDSIYSALNGGMQFADAARKFGSTENEKRNGGAVMGSPTLPQPIYDVMKGMKAGEYFKQPVKMNGFWYIFNLYSQKPYRIESDDDRKFFVQDMMNSQYSEVFYEDFLKLLKADKSFKKTAAADRARTSFEEFQKLKDTDILLSYGGQDLPVSDFREEIGEHAEDIKKLNSDQWKQLMEMAENNFLMGVYTENYEARPEVKEQLDELRQNMYSDYFYAQYVSKQVEEHPEWVSDYFNRHKSEFVKEAAAKGRVIIPGDESDVKKFMKEIKDLKNWDALKKQYQNKKNSKGEEIAKFNEGEMVESADVFKKYGVSFKQGVFTTKIGGKSLIIANDEILPGGPMTLEEAKQYTDVVEDTKAEFITKEITDERAKTKVEIEPGFEEALLQKFKK